MAADTATFITIFPEFREALTPALDFWLKQAQGTLALNRLGANADLACYLYMAHYMTLRRQAMAADAAGVGVGAPLGAVTSKSAGGLSVSYDSSLAASEGAGAWNATSYGQELYTLLRTVAMGGIYATVPNRPTVFVFDPSAL